MGRRARGLPQVRALTRGSTPVGMVFWLVLLTIVMYRLSFHAPLPERLLPTLFILVAPPAVGRTALAIGRREICRGRLNDGGRAAR